LVKRNFDFIKMHGTVIRIKNVTLFTWSGKYILDFLWVTSSCGLQYPLLPQVTYNVMVTAMCYLLSNCFYTDYVV